MYNAKIASLCNEYNELIDFCRSTGQISFEMYINDTYKKTLLLSAASCFEATITKGLHDFVSKKARQNPEIVAFVDNKAISRQYHTYFNWESKNANHFLGLFGDEFKQKVRKTIQEEGLIDAESAFLSLGQERNNLVHRNFIEVQINDTFEEIYAKYEKACRFVDLIIHLFEE